MPETDERGQTVNVFVAVVVVAMIMVVGLVVDGGQQTRAVSRAESVAAGAARAAGNVVASSSVTGVETGGAPVAAAQAFIAGSPDVEGEATLDDGVVRVRTRSTRPTIFLSLVGIDSVSGSGSATADVYPVRSR